MCIVHCKQNRCIKYNSECKKLLLPVIFHFEIGLCVNCITTTGEKCWNDTSIDIRPLIWNYFIASESSFKVANIIAFSIIFKSLEESDILYASAQSKEQWRSKITRQFTHACELDYTSRKGCSDNKLSRFHIFTLNYFHRRILYLTSRSRAMNHFSDDIYL